ncbi:DUF2283 domain-containing protein [Actinokineospora auranticolor]|uniref:Uncharacterized protein YuzE n=1 Tax=Actinokineospora auranticolor TaxID=155976 RepID=A0A2S6GK63_9PSEU|nr:DUF2283 domain-containing protein [Actinokineospora auranticolor]PPK65622.1 uncharacterized protein YuzE [Actinokineospora auranticolor]
MADAVPDDGMVAKLVPFTYDPVADASYLDLSGSGGEGPYLRQVLVQNPPGAFDVVFDLDADGRIAGIEVIGASAGLSAALLSADEPSE